MISSSELIELISDQGILPLYYHPDKELSIELLRALHRAGIRTVEYTNRGEQALENFKALRQVCDSELPGMQLGIGTIKDEKMAVQFFDAGADYLICPGLVESVANFALKNNITWIPGCMSPTEIIKAESLGAKFIKLFPGNILGPSYMAAIRELFPSTLFMPTGGVETTEENLRAWFNSGVSAVGMGSKLITKDLMEERRFEELEENVKTVLALVNRVRNK